MAGYITYILRRQLTLAITLSQQSAAINVQQRPILLDYGLRHRLRNEGGSWPPALGATCKLE